MVQWGGIYWIHVRRHSDGVGDASNVLAACINAVKSLQRGGKSWN